MRASSRTRRQGRHAQGGEHGQPAHDPGHDRERQSLMEVAARSMSTGSRAVGGIFPFTNSTPDELIADLTQAMSAEKGDSARQDGALPAAAAPRRGAVLARQSSQLKQAAESIRRLDRSNEAGRIDATGSRTAGRWTWPICEWYAWTGRGSSGRRGSRDVAPGATFRASAAAPRGRPPAGGFLPGPAAGHPDAAVLTQQARRSGAGFPPPPARRRCRPRRGRRRAPAGRPPSAGTTADEVNNLLLIYASPPNTVHRRRAARDRPPAAAGDDQCHHRGGQLIDSLRYGVQVFLKGRNIAGGASTSDTPLGASAPIHPAPSAEPHDGQVPPTPRS